jgi:hypothetical protein
MTGPNHLIRKITLPLGPQAGRVIDDIPPGILDIRLTGSDRISLTYDLRLTNLPAVEVWLSQSGLPLSPGFWARLYRRWLAFKDDNRRDQADIVHQCCSVPPPKE